MDKSIIDPVKQICPNRIIPDKTIIQASNKVKGLFQQGHPERCKSLLLNPAKAAISRELLDSFERDGLNADFITTTIKAEINSLLTDSKKLTEIIDTSENLVPASYFAAKTKISDTILNAVKMICNIRGDIEETKVVIAQKFESNNATANIDSIDSLILGLNSMFVQPDIIEGVAHASNPRFN